MAVVPQEVIRKQLAIIVRRWKLCAFILLTCLLAYALYFLATPPTYVARAELQYLQETPMQEITRFLEKIGASSSSSEDVIETQIRVLGSDSIVALALERMNVDLDQLDAERRQDLIERIKRGLNVQREGKTNILHVGLNSDDRDLPVPFVNHLIEVYRLHDMHQRRSRRETTRDFLIKEVSRYEEKLKAFKNIREQLAEIERTRGELRQIEAAREEVHKKIRGEIGRLRTEHATLAKRFKRSYPRFAEIERQIPWLGQLLPAEGTDPQPPLTTSAPSSPPPAGDAILRGFVYRGTLRQDALSGAIVTVEPGGYQAVTDKRGQYKLELPPGPVQVSVRREGYTVENFAKTLRERATTWGSVALHPSAGSAPAAVAPAALPGSIAAGDIQIEPGWKDWLNQKGALEQQIADTRRQLEESLGRLEKQGIDPEKVDFLTKEIQIDESIYGNFKTQLAQAELALSDISSNVTVLKQASVVEKTIRPQLRRDLPLVLVSSLMLFVGLAFLLEAFSATTYSPEEIERGTGARVLGVLPFTAPSPTILLRPAKTLDSSSRRSQALARDLCRMLKTNLDVALHGEERRIIVITSCTPSEGKTISSVALTQTFATAGFRVLLINANVRHPSLNKLFGLKDQPGLLEVLAGKVSLDDAIRRFEGLPFNYLPGHLYPGMSSSEAYLHAPTLRPLFDEIAKRFDYAFIDTPPLLRVSDTLEFARLVNKVILVYSAGRTPLPVLQHAVQMLTRAQARLMGIIVNYTRPSRVVGYHPLSYPYPTRPYYSPSLPST
ncbi:MAG: AAA family ATPase [Nitrospirae bacterium]|nr:AAA family ATPase [Nitrospirota bacterium]